MTDEAEHAAIAAVKSLYRGWSESGGANVEEIIALIDDDIEIHTLFPAENPLGIRDAYRGAAGLVRYFEDLDAAWEMTEYAIDEFIADIAGTGLVMRGRLGVRLRERGVEARSSIVSIARLRGGKVVALHEYCDTHGLLTAGAAQGGPQPNPAWTA